MQPQYGTAQFVRKKPAPWKEFKPVSLEVSSVLLGEHRSHHCWRNLAGQPWDGGEWLPPSVCCTSLFMTGQPMRMKHFYVFLSEGQENQCKSFLTIQEQGGTTSLSFFTHPFCGILFQMRFRQLKIQFLSRSVLMTISEGTSMWLTKTYLYLDSFKNGDYFLIRNTQFWFFFLFLFVHLCLLFVGGVMYCIPEDPLDQGILSWSLIMSTQSGSLKSNPFPVGESFK